MQHDSLYEAQMKKDHEQSHSGCLEHRPRYTVCCEIRNRVYTCRRNAFVGAIGLDCDILQPPLQNHGILIGNLPLRSARLHSWFSEHYSFVSWVSGSRARSQASRLLANNGLLGLQPLTRADQ